VKADRNVEWDEVAQAIDVAHSAGIQNVGLLTKELQQ
jgi:biopolymer transport protein ExbD